MARPMDTVPPIVGAAVVSSAVLYPVDVVRALCMSNPGIGCNTALRGFVSTYGLAGFVRQGLAAEVTRASISRTITFWLQPLAHAALFSRSANDGTPFTKGVAGVAASVPQVVAITPLENIKLAAQLDTAGRFGGSRDIAMHLVRARGVFGGLFMGFFGMQLRGALWTGGFFLTIDVFKSAASGVGVKNPIATDALAGFCAGTTGVLLNCYTDVARSVLQRQALADTFEPAAPRRPASEHLSPAIFGRALRDVYKSRGLGGLYAGFGPKCAHLGGQGAALAVLVPRINEWWFKTNGIF